MESINNISINKDLKKLEESKRSLHKSIVDSQKNLSQRIENKNDSAFGSEVAEEDHQPIDKSADEHSIRIIGMSTKPASHSTASTFTSFNDIDPNHKFSFTMSSIPVFKELEYRRTHLRHVNKDK